MPLSQRTFIAVNALAILDTTAHTPLTDATAIIPLDAHEYDYIVMQFVSSHDQIIRCQVFGAIGVANTLIATAATTNPSRLGAAIDVLAVAASVNGTQMRTAGKQDGSITPLMYVQCTALVTPTTGSITVTFECFGNTLI